LTILVTKSYQLIQSSYIKIHYVSNW
jgi:hypothetical protein